MSTDLWQFQKDQQVTLQNGAVAQVLQPTQDGRWIRVKYIHSPDQPDIVGTEDLCHQEELLPEHP